MIRSERIGQNKGIELVLPPTPGGVANSAEPREILNNRLRQIEEDLAEVEQEMETRRALSHQILSTVLAKLSGQREDLKDLPSFNFTQDPHLQARRAALERDIDTLERELRQEDVAMWRDKARLEEEARRLRREQRAAFRRLELIENTSSKP